MDYLNGTKTITEALCKELLAECDFNFSVEADIAFHKKLREKAQAEYGFADGDDDSYFRGSNNISRVGGDRDLNKTSNSAELLAGGGSGKASGNRGAFS